MDLSVVLTSAAVSAAVAGLFTFVSQWLEGRARRQEFLLRLAAEWAAMYQARMRDEAEARDEAMLVPNIAMATYEYHRMLASLWKHHRLPRDVAQNYEAWKAARAHAEGSRP